MNATSIALLVMLAGTLGAFAFSAYRRLQLLKTGAPCSAFDRVGPRLRELVVTGFLQKNLLREPLPGIMHLFIFWGFLVLLLRTASLVVYGFSPSIFHQLMGNPLGHAYLLTKDVFAVLVMLGIGIAIYRRVITRPSRLTFSGEALVILGTIGLIMLCDFLFDAAELALLAANPTDPSAHAAFLAGARSWTPVGAWLSRWLTGWSSGALEATATGSYFLHIGLILGFLNYLPYGKHFHIITSLPNVFLASQAPKGALRAMPDLEKTIEANGTLGVDKVEAYPWKDLLDLYSCTECGRCQAACPAWSTNKPLSPKKVVVGQRDHLYTKAQHLLSKEKDKVWNGPALISDGVISKDVIWACTACRNCEEVCPVRIQHVQRIIDMRRYLVSMENDFPKELNATFRGMESSGNPWGLPQQKRADWAQGLNVPLASAAPEFDVLYWVGCAASYDSRNQKTARALAQVLQAAGVKFAILGPEEACTGDSARRLGNEYLFQLLAQRNIEILNRYRVKKIVSACPHCCNTLANDYPQLGGHYEVVHSSVFLRELIHQGRLKLKAGALERIAYHDPCYLGRFNDRYREPRELIRLTSPGRLLEAERTGCNSFCCGAGGGRMWMEEHAPRINATRLEQLLETKPQAIAVACPFCMTMFTDANKDKAVGDQVQIKDVVELAAENLAR